MLHITLTHHPQEEWEKQKQKTTNLCYADLN